MFGRFRTTSSLRDMRRARAWAGWLVTAVAIAVALGRAATAPLVDRPTPSAEPEEREVFELLASEESAMRKKAAGNFPGDPWSQDDDFHNAERQRAIWFSDRKGLSLPHVLRALDDGLHGRWPAPPDASVQPTVPPCRPRLAY